MDETPFLEINMLDIKENQVAELKKFHKSQFDINNIFNVASDLKYSNEFKLKIAAQLQQPNDDFVKFFLNGTYEGKFMQSVVDRFRPVLKKALNDYISELMNDKIKNALGTSAEIEPTEEPKEEIVEETRESKVVTTEEELEAFYLVKNMLKSYTAVENITHKDTETYFGALFKGKTTRWICRFYFNSSKKYLAIPDENKKEVKYQINGVYDIDNYQSQIINSLNRYLQ